MNATRTLIPLEAVDPAMAEELLDVVFGPERHSRTAYAIREGTEWLPALSFAVVPLVSSSFQWPTNPSVGATVPV